MTNSNSSHQEIRCLFPTFDNIQQTSAGLSEEKIKERPTTFYEALDTKTHRRVFIKRINIQENTQEFVAEREFLKKFSNGETIELIREAIENCQDPQYGYFVFPLAEGGDLFTLAIEQEWTPTNEEFTKLAFNLLTSLAKIHKAGCIIRDIKLDNIVYLDPHLPVNVDNIKFIDFGSAYIEGLSATKNFRGTENYYAPEYIYRQKLTSAFDIWSLGITFYAIIAKYFPTEEPPNPNYEYPYAYHFNDENIDKLFETEDFVNYSDDIKQLIKSMLTYNDEFRPSAEKLLEMEMFNQYKIDLDNQVNLYE